MLFTNGDFEKWGLELLSYTLLSTESYPSNVSRTVIFFPNRVQSQHLGVNQKRSFVPWDIRHEISCIKRFFIISYRKGIIFSRSMGQAVNFYTTLERLSGRWWFLLILFLLFFIPSYSAVEIDPVEIPKLIVEILSNPLIYSFPVIYPLFKIIPIVFIVLLAMTKNRAVRAFDIYVAALSLGFASLQTTAVTGMYGLSILTGNLVVYTIVAFFWVVDAVVKENEITGDNRTLWRYWVAPFAFFSFWYPIDTATLAPDFSPLYMLSSESGLTYCMMTPVLLAIVMIFFSKLNRAAIRVTGFAGTVTGLFNIVQIVVNPTAWWMGVLHIPLFVVSLYAFSMSFSRDKQEAGLHRKLSM
jgi:hypothetical protein